MNKRASLILLILIVVVSAFLRLYRISSYMEFLGDEGRDAIVAKGILHGELTLLGPRSSAGDFYMGPFYYYLITPFLWLANYDPVGPAIMVALFGVATVLLIYYVAKKLFDEKAGLFAASLYSISPLVLAYSHSSWNPDVLPFFALLLMYLIYVSVAFSKSWKYYFLDGILLGLCLQLHYLSLFLAVIIFAYILISAYLKNKKIVILSLLKKYFLIAIGALISLSPFFLFEFRHNFLNARGIYAFVFGNHVSYAPGANFFESFAIVFFRIFGRLVFDFPAPEKMHLFPPIQLYIWAAVVIVFAIWSLIVLFKQKNKQVKLLLGLWLFLGVLFFGFYKREIYDYLFTFIFPLPFILVGNLLAYIYNVKKKPRIFYMSVSLIIFAVIMLVNYSGILLRSEPNNQRNQARDIAKFVISKTNNEPYNFALLSGGNADYAYRYYMDILDKNPVTIENPGVDPKRKSVTKQLFVVCEDINCEPVGNPLWEIAGFGRAEISEEWKVSVVKVYKLIHYQKES